MDDRVIVVGGGAAGLATAAALARRGCPVAVLERGATPGTSWRGRYDRLRLNSARAISHLPGARYPRHAGRWIPRDEVVAHLRRFADHHGLDVRTGVAVERVDRTDGGWTVRTDAGDLPCRAAVVATGLDRDPHVPPWPGRDAFPGSLIHAAAYRNADPYVGRDVLVVGAGSSGNEIAAELVERGARRVRVAVRTPPTIFPRSWLGVPTSAVGAATSRLPDAVVDRVAAWMQHAIYGDLGAVGLPRPAVGVATRVAATGHGIAIDSGLIDALRRGEAAVVAPVQRIEDGDVVLADDTRVRPDAIIAATGYRLGLEPLVGHLDVLDGRGRPRAIGAAHAPGAPGLHFVGYRATVAAPLFTLRRDARAAARASGGRGASRPSRRPRSGWPASRPTASGT